MSTTPQQQSAQEAREKYILAFNATMIQIWQERITLLDVIDTGALLRSPLSLPVKADGRFFEVTLSQAFLEYGLWNQTIRWYELMDYVHFFNTGKIRDNALFRLKKKNRKTA